MPWGSQQEGFKQTSSPNQFLFSLTHNVTIPLESNGHSSDHYVGEGALFTSYNNGYVPAFSMLTNLLSIASRVGLVSQIWPAWWAVTCLARWPIGIAGRSGEDPPPYS